MLATLQIKDETLFGSNQEIFSSSLNFQSNRISVRELIEMRVRQEVEDYNTAQPEIFRGLVQPGIAERVLNGFKMPKKSVIDWQDQYKNAVQAFERNGFIVLVDDLQIEDLNQVIEIEPETVVTFLKLVPLVGG